MAEVTTLARPYAEAVFKLADQSGSLVNWAAVLARLTEAAGNADMHAAISDPKIPSDKLVDLFAATVGGTPSAEVSNFLTLLARNGRLALLPQIHDQFETMKRDREGVLQAAITSAFDMNDGQLAGLVNDLETKYKRKIKPHVTVDKELIGGVIIAIGDEVIDASIRGKLQHMATALTS